MIYVIILVKVIILSLRNSLHAKNFDGVIVAGNQ
jgi:hypothetical protein